MGILDLREASAEKASATVKKEIVESCLASPSQLHGIADALMTTKGKLQIAAAEVLAEIAETRPDLISTHVPSIMRIADEKSARASKLALSAMAAAATADPSAVARYQKELEGFAKAGGKLRTPALAVLGRLGSASPRWAGSVRPVLLGYIARAEADQLPETVGAAAPAFLPNAERELQAVLEKRIAALPADSAATVMEKAQTALRKATRKRAPRR